MGGKLRQAYIYMYSGFNESCICIPTITYTYSSFTSSQ